LRAHLAYNQPIAVCGSRLIAGSNVDALNLAIALGSRVRNPTMPIVSRVADRFEQLRPGDRLLVLVRSRRSGQEGRPLRRRTVLAERLTGVAAARRLTPAGFSSKSHMAKPERQNSR
jgi:hypothetical protein